MSEIVMFIFVAVFVLGLVGFFFYEAVIYPNIVEKKEWNKICYDFLKRNITDDVDERIIDVIKRGYTIEKVKYTFDDIVFKKKSVEVIVRVRAYDYALKKKVTGYFSIEYCHFSGSILCFNWSRSMSLETKLAANVPYGGWFKE